MDATNSSTVFTSVLPSFGSYAGVNLPPQVDVVLDTLSRLSGWTIALTVLAVLVAYDQSMRPPCAPMGALTLARSRAKKNHTLTTCS